MTVPEAQPDSIRASRMALLVVYSSFVLAGVVTIILGPLLPILIARWSLSDARAGLFFTLQFCGNLLGIASIGALISRRGYGQTIGIGFTFIAIGIAGLNLGTESFSLAAAAFLGYGLGLVLSATNLWVAEVAGSRRAAALMISNLAWGIGAITCPLLVMLAQRNQRLGLFLFGLAGLSAFFTLVLASLHLEPRLQSGVAETAFRAVPTVGIKTGIALGAFFFVYCGVESAIGGWTAAFAKRLGTSRGNLWELAPMFFWAGLLSGRALGPLVLRKVPERTVLILGLMLAAICNGALLVLTNLGGAAICLVGIGLGCACIFPLLLASLVGYYGRRATRVASIAFALASLGGATIPWLVGFTSTQAGSLRAGLSAPLIGCVAMLGLSCLLPKQPLT